MAPGSQLASSNTMGKISNGCILLYTIRKNDVQEGEALMKFRVLRWTFSRQFLNACMPILYLQSFAQDVVLVMR